MVGWGGDDGHGKEQGGPYRTGSRDGRELSAFDKVRRRDGSVDWEVTGLAVENHVERFVEGEPCLEMSGLFNSLAHDAWEDMKQVLGENLMRQDITGLESSFETAKKMLAASLLFPLAGEGEYCACRLKQGEFGWRGFGRCKMCKIRDGSRRGDTEREGYLNDLVHRGGMWL